MKWTTLVLIFTILLTPQLCLAKRSAKTIFADQSKLNRKWSRLFRRSDRNLKYLFNLLSDSSTGRKLLKKAKIRARAMGKTLLEVVIPGSGSLTDSTLYRRFSASNPEQVIFESNSLVYINSDLPVIDAVLDLSHELTHFVYRKAFNPYKDSFNVKEFITATIEGSGGEVDAFLNECRVLKELFRKSNSSRYHCHLIKDHDGDLSRRLAKFHFYKVGQGHHYLTENLHKKGHEIQYLSDENPVFISSTYGDSYPMAAYKEYITVKEKACKNEGRRVSYIKQASGRSPAYVKKSYQKIINSYESRCL